MLTSRSFLRRTRAGAVRKVVREHYLRDDIPCGVAGCRLCGGEEEEEDPAARPGLQARPDGAFSSLCPTPHYLLPDTNLLLHQIDILEDPVIRNVIILQTVLQEVRNRSAPVHKRIKDVFTNREKHFYSFTNEHHKDTYIEQQQGENPNDRNDRAIRVAVKWYSEHLQKLQTEEKIQVILLTNDRKNKERAVEEGITAYTCEEYIKSLIANPELVDRLASLSDEGNEIETGRIIFPEHLPLSKLQQGIKSNLYLQGTFRANRDNYLEATVWIHGDGEEKEIIIQGLRNLNRAVHEDIVAVDLLPKDDWVAPSSVVLHDENQNEDDADQEEEKENSLKGSSSNSMLRPTGRIIGIIKRNWRPYCGMLSPSQIKEARRHLFTPADRRIPRIRIETRQASTLDGHRIIVAIDGWPRNSRYPNGHFVKNLGAAGDKQTETEVLLLEHDVPHQPFSQAVLSFLPQMPWNITEQDMKNREDLRDLCVCSVDPPGCTDIDDALHCRDLENGNLEVGVHIADVSHFIRPGNALDQESAQRGTTVYLCEKRIDMVPELLSSNLCSLKSNVDRLAFSCIWEMTHNAEIVRTRFTKSVINSKGEISQLPLDPVIWRWSQKVFFSHRVMLALYMMEKSKKSSLVVARSILNNKLISKKLQQYLKGENPFTDDPEEKEEHEEGEASTSGNMGEGVPEGEGNKVDEETKSGDNLDEENPAEESEAESEGEEQGGEGEEAGQMEDLNLNTMSQEALAAEQEQESEGERKEIIPSEELEPPDE